ncbi:replicative DNA helicase [Arsenophonus endosymbiont of Crataerina pallida]|uniref:replicative DNA helicase n=1 Tax=Arsenophonus endosymbiont of Crataerina pallida TaxID=3066235 RepID=UPI0030D0C46C
MINQVPNNLPAEQSVIGGLLIDPMSDNALKVFSLLSPDDFYATHHRLIYAEMRAMSRKRQAIDIITVDEALSKSGMAQKVGGFAYLAEIAKNTPSAANIVSYAKSIKESAAGRYTVEKAIEIQKLFTQPNVLGFTDKIDIAQRLIDEATKFGKVGHKTGLRRIDDVLDSVFTDICDRQDNPEKHCGLKTGFRDFDDLLKPKQIVNGSLFVVGARPKMGKTTVLTEMAKNVSNQGRTVFLFSMEIIDNLQ